MDGDTGQRGWGAWTGLEDLAMTKGIGIANSYLGLVCARKLGHLNYVGQGCDKSMP